MWPRFAKHQPLYHKAVSCTEINLFIIFPPTIKCLDHATNIFQLVLLRSTYTVTPSNLYKNVSQITILNHFKNMQKKKIFHLL